MTNNDIVQKLWNLCDVLRDYGINYSDYMTELVLLLFSKMEFKKMSWSSKSAATVGDVFGAMGGSLSAD